LQNTEAFIRKRHKVIKLRWATPQAVVLLILHCQILIFLPWQIVKKLHFALVYNAVNYNIGIVGIVAVQYNLGLPLVFLTGKTNASVFLLIKYANVILVGAGNGERIFYARADKVSITPVCCRK
jgi:hypothetical protein